MVSVFPDVSVDEEEEGEKYYRNESYSVGGSNVVIECDGIEI